MNLIDESFEPKKPKDKNKKIAKIILIVMIVILIAIIGLMGAIFYIQNNTLKLYINGSLNEKVKDLMIVEDDGTVYFPIKDVASYLGYKSYNGEYSDKSEDKSKCYVQCDDEVANFTLNSKKIYKLTTTNNNGNYEYCYTDKPVKAINGNLYATADGIEKAFNISFTYDTGAKRVYIYTMPYLIENYSSKVLDYGYSEISQKFTNKKSVLNSMLVIYKKDEKKYGVIDLKGNAILEAKYENIEYLPGSGDFLVTSNKKVGIISAKKETKIQILYDSLELIDNDLGLYLAKKDNKYGVIDSKGNIKVYIEYDEIGVDISKFEKNDIKNKYLIADNLIPARKDKVWGLFDKNGNEVVGFEYDSLGYIASSNKDAYNLLVVPDYNVIVACKNKKYTLINSSGKNLCAPVLDDIYMTISSGAKHYYMTYNDKTLNVEEFLDSQGVKATNNNQSSDSKSKSSETSNEVKNQNETNNQTTEEQVDEDNQNQEQDQEQERVEEQSQEQDEESQQEE